MKLIARNDPFHCGHCNRSVEPVKRGGYRDHCPFCLYGQHVDERLPGDRASFCEGMLIPFSVSSTAKKGFIIHYRCERCEVERVNKAASDDDYEQILLLSVREG